MVHLCWNENLVKCQNAIKYYVHDGRLYCLQGIVFIFNNISVTIQLFEFRWKRSWDVFLKWAHLSMPCLTTIIVKLSFPLISFLVSYFSGNTSGTQRSNSSNEKKIIIMIVALVSLLSLISVIITVIIIHGQKRKWLIREICLFQYLGIKIKQRNFSDYFYWKELYLLSNINKTFAIYYKRFSRSNLKKKPYVKTATLLVFAEDIRLNDTTLVLDNTYLLQGIFYSTINSEKLDVTSWLKTVTKSKVVDKAWPNSCVLKY